MNTTVQYNDKGKPFYVEIHRDIPKDAPRVAFWIRKAYELGLNGQPSDIMQKLGCLVYDVDSAAGMGDYLVLTLDRLPVPLPEFLSLPNH